ncbi:MAG TPA: prepilin peptidase [Gemmatimonadales bacterium]|nr:prepilin peptidase [Gemmatimonadales bacterium]
MIASAALTTLLGLSVWFDVRYRRIPNLLTVAGLGAAIVLRALLGFSAVVEGVEGAVVGLALALVPFALGMLGGGDVKLLAAVGGFMGPSRLIGAFLAIALVGGVLALLEALRRRAAREVMSRSFAVVKNLALLGRAGYRPTLESEGAMTVPYGVAIAVGSLGWWFVTGGAL